MNPGPRLTKEEEIELEKHSQSRTQENRVSPDIRTLETDPSLTQSDSLFLTSG